MKRRNKAGMLAISAAVLDVLACVVIGYIAVQTMSLLAWVILLTLGLMFAFDAVRAIRFLVELFKR